MIKDLTGVNENLQKRSFPRYLPFVLVILLYFPSLVKQGMFLDGITYAAISNNLANGLGTFWAPHYTQTLYPGFVEHPPLILGIQALFFKLFGSGFLTERIFSLFALMISAVAISLNWRLINPDPRTKRLSWLPVSMWLITPIILWSYRNNMLENVVTALSLFSTYFILRFEMKSRWLDLLMAAILLDLNILSKGPVGLFPLLVPVLYHIFSIRGRFFRAISHSLLLILLAIMLLVFYGSVDKGLFSNLNQYLNQQLFPALEGKREITSDNHLYLIGSFLKEMAVPVGLIILIFFISKMKREQLRFSSTSWIFILLGFSSFLPLLITLKQRSYYLVPSIPFFVIGIALLVAPVMKSLEEKMTHKWRQRVNVLFILLTFAGLTHTAMNYGRYGRDRGLLQDIYRLQKIIPKNQVAGSTSEMTTDWKLQAYLARVLTLSIDTGLHHQFLIRYHSDQLNIPPASEFTEADERLKFLKLYRKKK